VPKFLKSFRADERGTAPVEFVLIAVIVSISIISATQSIAGELNGMLNQTSSAFQSILAE
jgi:Flp pilus assembly pilin Flp